MIPLPLLVLAALGLGGVALAAQQSPQPAPAGPTAFPGGAAPAGPAAPGAAPAGPPGPAMQKGKWYRVKCKTGPLSALSADVRALQTSLQAAGFYAISMLPLGPTECDAIGHYESDAPTVPSAALAPWTLVSADLVATPPQDAQRNMTPPALDAALDVASANAVQIALAVEKNASALAAFGSAMLPDFPAAAALLKTQGALLSHPEGAATQVPPPPTPSPASSGVASGAGPRNLGENWPYGLKLYPNGDRLVSRGGGYQLWLPADGNLAIDDCSNGFGHPGHKQWRASDAGLAPFGDPAYAILQTDGEIVVFDRAGRKRFSNRLHNPHQDLAPGGALLQTDGNLVVYDRRGVAGGGPRWASQLGLSHSALADVGKALEGVAQGAADAVSSAASAVGDAGKIAGGIVANIATTVTFSKPLLGFVSDVASGKNIVAALSDVPGAALENAKAVAPIVESVVSVVPGIGAPVASALAVGCALAEGKPMTDALLDAAAAAIPGGAIAQEAFKLARTAVSGVAAGKSLSDIGLDALRAHLPEGPAKSAFDAGVALAQGKTLQDVGFQAAKDLLPGTIASQANGVFQIAGQVGKDASKIAGKLEDNLRGELAKIGPQVSGQLQKLVAQVVSDPSLAKLTSSDLARKIGVLEPVARAALASVSVGPRPTTPGPAGRPLTVVRTARLERLLPHPAPRPAVPRSELALAKKVGIPSAAAMSVKLAASPSPKDQDKAAALARAALLLQRQALVNFYLARGQGPAPAVPAASHA